MARAFDDLPDGTLISDKTIAVLFSVSRSTVWRWVKTGILPSPVPVGPRLTRWRMGDIRRVLHELAQQDQQEAE